MPAREAAHTAADYVALEVKWPDARKLVTGDALSAGVAAVTGWT